MTVASTSQAKDLLYRFGRLRRLRDAQDPANTSARQVFPTSSLEPLGHAIREGQPQVVPYRRGGSTDIDFPTISSTCSDRFEFDIEDLPCTEDDACRAARGHGRHVAGPEAACGPSCSSPANREKQTPEPFLRRCLYDAADFPANDPAMLAEIVRKNLDARAETISDELVTGAVERLCRIRERTASQACRSSRHLRLVDCACSTGSNRKVRGRVRTPSTRWIVPCCSRSARHRTLPRPHRRRGRAVTHTPPPLLLGCSG